LNTFNILIINEKDNENFVKLFRKGEFIFEFRDLKISENSFSRFIQDQKYIFKNNKLISTEIFSVYGNICIYPLYEDTNAIQLKQNSINPLYKIINFIENSIYFKNYKAELFILFELFLISLVFTLLFIFPEEIINISTVSTYNIIKLRKVSSKYI
jgi:hypothetical protein